MKDFANSFFRNICICLISGMLIIIIMACERVDEYGCPTAFSSSSVYDDCKRIPLVYPYEIVNFYDNVELSRWDKRQNGVREIPPDLQFSHILRFAQTNDHIFAEHDIGWVRPCGEIQYFVFSLVKTNAVRFTDKQAFASYCSTFGGDVKEMRPFIEQWKSYWAENSK